MSYKEEFEKLLGTELITKLRKLSLKFAGESVVTPADAPMTMIDVPLTDGTVLQVEKLEVGGMANIADAPAPDADYMANDGTVITVVAGMIAEIASVKEEATEEATAPIVAGINSQLEAVTKRLADIEAKFSAQTIELKETKEGLGVALSTVNKLVSMPVNMSVENQKPTSKTPLTDITKMTNFQKLKFNRGESVYEN